MEQQPAEVRRIRYYKTKKKIIIPANSTEFSIIYLTYLFNTLKVPVTTTIYFNDKIVKGGSPALRTETNKIQRRVKLKTVIVGNSVTFKTDIDYAMIENLEKCNPDALALQKEVEGTAVEYFRISTGKVSSMNNFGVTFADQENGKAMISVLIPDKIKDKKKYVTDTYFKTLLNLTELEKNISKAQKDLDKLMTAIDSAIEVIE